MIILTIFLIEVIICLNRLNLVSSACINNAPNMVTSTIMLEDASITDESIITAAKVAVSTFTNRINIDDIYYEIMNAKVGSYIQNNIIFKEYSIQIWIHQDHAICTFSIQENTLLNTTVIPSVFCVSDNPPYFTSRNI